MAMTKETKPFHRGTYQQLHKLWERNWSRQNFAPSWVITEIPKEVQEAVTSGWFVPGGSVLDIGCGTGDLAIWLAEHGFDVLGVDFSPSAIEKAKRNACRYQGSHSLLFRVADMCFDAAPEPKFHALLDRGCLQGLPKGVQANYAKTVASWALPGAHFLLIFGFGQGGRRAIEEEEARQKETMAHLQRVFMPYFDIIKMELTFMERHPPHDFVPAVAVCMERRDSQ